MLNDEGQLWGKGEEGLRGWRVVFDLKDWRDGLLDIGLFLNFVCSLFDLDFLALEDYFYFAFQWLQYQEKRRMVLVEWILLSVDF